MNLISLINSNDYVNKLVKEISTENKIERSDISLVIHTCDKYDKFWEPWYFMLGIHGMFDLGWPVYFCNEQIDLPFSDPRINQIKTGLSKKYVESNEDPEWKGTNGENLQVDTGWSNRLIHVLENINTEYIFYMQEDHWPKKQVDKEIFNELFDLTKHNKLDSLRLSRLLEYYPSQGYEQSDITFKNDKFLKITKDAEYVMSHQPSFWNRKFLLDSQIPNEGFRVNEYTGSDRIKKNSPNFKIYQYQLDWYFDGPGAASNGQMVERVQWELQQIKSKVVVDNHFSLKRKEYVPKSQGLKLSLVTSCYNAENYLDELFQSISNQSYDNWEWIVADDFSEDGTLSKLHELQKLDSRIRIVYPKHKKEIWWNPQTHALGDIVCHIDADDKLMPNTLNHINHYFTTFSDVVVMHYNSNKYNQNFPDQNNLGKDFIENVYMTTDNDSFLEGFEKLSMYRSGIFGYLRIFRNLPNLYFPVHSDDDICCSNDGQWLLVMEEHGKSLTIPRTSYLTRSHGDSESHRNWDIRGEAQLVTEARNRRKSMILEYPRNVKYFDSIYDAAESTYLSKLNYELTSQNVSFINFNYDNDKKSRLQKLFYDHNLFFDHLSNDVKYFFYKIQLNDNIDVILKSINPIKKVCESPHIVLYTDNVALHQSSRKSGDNISNIVNGLQENGFIFFWKLDQISNRFFITTT